VDKTQISAGCRGRWPPPQSRRRGSPADPSGRAGYRRGRPGPHPRDQPHSLRERRLQHHRPNPVPRPVAFHPRWREPNRGCSPDPGRQRAWLRTKRTWEIDANWLSPDARGTRHQRRMSAWRSACRSARQEPWPRLVCPLDSRATGNQVPYWSS